MAFKVLFLAHTPDADPGVHRCLIETGTFRFTGVLVRNQHQALDVCRKMMESEGIHSVLLCPGFTHEDIAEISEVVGQEVGVSVARGDGRSNRIALETMRREGWFTDRPK